MDTQKGRKHNKLIGATFLKQKYILHEQIHFMIKKIAICYSIAHLGFRKIPKRRLNAYG